MIIMIIMIIMISMIIIIIIIIIIITATQSLSNSLAHFFFQFGLIFSKYWTDWTQ